MYEFRRLSQPVGDGLEDYHALIRYDHAHSGWLRYDLTRHSRRERGTRPAGPVYEVRDQHHLRRRRHRLRPYNGASDPYNGPIDDLVIFRYALAKGSACGPEGRRRWYCGAIDII